MWRRLLPFLAVLLLVPSLAFAGANLKQNDDGSTSWVDENAETWPVGDSGLTVTIEDISTAATDFVVTRRPGRIKKILVVNDVAFTAGSDESVLDFGISTGDGTYTPFGGSLEVITVPTTLAGVVASLVPTTTYTVTQDDVISIHTDGAGTGTVVGTVTIVIE